jgi:hypothetical protein
VTGLNIPTSENADDSDDCYLKKFPNPISLDSVPRDVFTEITTYLAKCIAVSDN